MPDPYSDPVTGVLSNKLGLDTASGLEAAEREITHAALIMLDESSVPSTYDLPHLREIHRRIFGDIYDWAGQIRTVAIAKGSATFCLPQYIESSAAVIFTRLRDEGFLRNLDREAFTGRLAYYLGEVNALHPFREGNGRAQRGGATENDRRMRLRRVTCHAARALPEGCAAPSVRRRAAFPAGRRAHPRAG